MKKAMGFLMVVLMMNFFSCKKNSVEISPEKPAGEELQFENSALQRQKEMAQEQVTEKAVKEFFRAYVTAENVPLKLDSTGAVEDAGFVEQGDVVEILSRSGERIKRQRDFNYWFRVKTLPGVTGWIYGGDLDFFSADPDYSTESDLQLVHAITVESNYFPLGAGNEFLGTVNYLIVDENAGIREIYLFDKYILMFFKQGYDFSVFDYDENLKFEDYPVFGNVVVDVSTMLGPVGIWHDFLIVSSKIGDGPKSRGYEASDLEIYNLKDGRLSCEGTYFDDIWPGKTNTVKLYQKIAYDSEEGKTTYNEFLFDFTTETLNPTGEIKTYVYISLQ
jgi:hypothetical protein